MTARREQIILAVVARLGSVAGVVQVVREPSAQPTSLPAYTVEDQGQRVLVTDATHNTFQMRLLVTGLVDGGRDAVAPAANELYASAVRAIMASPDQLGGLVDDVIEGDMEPVTAKLDQKFTSTFELALVITYRARTHDPALI